MTQAQYKKIIEAELYKLNERIDAKIIKGVAYTEESRRHKFLLIQIKQQNKPGFWDRLFSSSFSF